MTTALEGGGGVSVTPRPLFTPGKDPVPILLEDGLAPGPVWTGAENLAPTGIRSFDRPARRVTTLTTLPDPRKLKWEGYKSIRSLLNDTFKCRYQWCSYDFGVRGRETTTDAPKINY